MFTVISNILPEEPYFDKLGILSKLLAYIQIPFSQRLLEEQYRALYYSIEPVEGYDLGKSLRRIVSTETLFLLQTLQ